MNNSLGIKLLQEFDQERLKAFLAEKFSFYQEEPVHSIWTFYDTFDWRLFRKDRVLYLSGNSLTLRRLSDGEHLDSLLCDQWSMFADGLQDSSLKRKLQSILGIRALLILGSVHTRASVYRILNNEIKTISRLVHLEVGCSPIGEVPAPDSYLILQPVRGYPGHARKIEDAIDPLGRSISIWEDVYSSAMTSMRLKPAGYSSSLGLQLDPDLRSDRAVKLILRRLLEIMIANQAGIKADIDTEFLHDYRIAVRKTRAALSQLGAVLPNEKASRFKQDFAYLGKQTNALRDLDVYLLSEEKYRAMLPDNMREDIDPLFAKMKLLRSDALADVIKGIESPEYAAILEHWQEFLDTPDESADPGRLAGLPVIELARGRIFKRYRKIVKDGYSIIKHTDDARLHDLRIECKKLRYLIEFFASLFPRKKVRRLLKQLKALQDNLGDFNDLEVQQAYLLGIAHQLPIEEERARLALIATGYLVDNLEHRRLVVKGKFSQTFTDFTIPKNQKLYYELFKANSTGKSR